MQSAALEVCMNAQVRLDRCACPPYTVRQVIDRGSSRDSHGVKHRTVSGLKGCSTKVLSGCCEYPGCDLCRSLFDSPNKPDWNPLWTSWKRFTTISSNPI